MIMRLLTAMAALNNRGAVARFVMALFSIYGRGPSGFLFRIVSICLARWNRPRPLRGSSFRSQVGILKFAAEFIIHRKPGQIILQAQCLQYLRNKPNKYSRQ